MSGITSIPVSELQVLVPINFAKLKVSSGISLAASFCFTFASSLFVWDSLSLYSSYSLWYILYILCVLAALFFLDPPWSLLHWSCNFSDHIHLEQVEPWWAEWREENKGFYQRVKPRTCKNSHASKNGHFIRTLPVTACFLYSAL